jgi:hypothetical protein
MGMTTATPIGRVIAPEIRDAIQGAAKRTGISFDFLVRQAEIESGLDPRAKASTSSATGLYQFIESTWLRMIRQHGAKYGHAEAAQAISPTGAPRVGDPAMRARILELRKDPALSAAMAAEYTRSNQDQLRLALRREPTANELYMAHFLGPQSASRFLQAWASDRTAVAADVVPDAAGPNRRVFFAPDGRPRSVEEVLSARRRHPRSSAPWHGPSAASPKTPRSSPPPPRPASRSCRACPATPAFRRSPSRRSRPSTTARAAPSPAASPAKACPETSLPRTPPTGLMAGVRLVRALSGI